jgi:cation diffusion facilitator family transporter
MKSPPRRPDLPPEARARERSMLTGVLADVGIALPYNTVAVWSGNLTMIAEAVRGGLLIILETVVYVLMRRIHRGRLHDYEFGSGKLEQFTNLVVGAAMALGAAWMASKALGRLLDGPPPPPSGLMLALGVVFAALNLLVNIGAAWEVWRAGRDGTSVIMIGQIRSRLTKVFASLVVLAAVATGALDGGGILGHWADICGTAFVSVVMLGVTVSLWRDSLPDLLDRSLGEERQAGINRVLAAHFDRYDDLVAVRSRQSGRRIHVEVELGLPPASTIAEAERLGASLREAIRAELPGAEVLVIPRAAAKTY